MKKYYQLLPFEILLEAWDNSQTHRYCSLLRPLQSFTAPGDRELGDIEPGGSRLQEGNNVDKERNPDVLDVSENNEGKV